MSFAQETRTVFDAHHRQQAADEAIFNRLTALVTPEYFGMASADFKGLRILDAGCGSNANASAAFLALGAQVHSVDVGEAWMDCAQSRLEQFGDSSTLGAEDILNLSLPTGGYDVVHCAGVLHHTLDPRKGFAELARVTRPGGRTFITVMANGDGVLYEWINALRRRYQADEQFRRAIDGLSHRQIEAWLDWLFAVKANNEIRDTDAREEAVVRSLFDDDLVLTIKDRLQAPTYSEFAFTEKQLREWYAEEGFDDVRRLTRYTKGFANLRRFLAPMYLEYANPYSRMWFGEGYVQLIGTKRA
jgi:2-polyprenyl-3-methyl-5-hydroxy-6-metoxy-1,4-benzoquinol methylase